MLRTTRSRARRTLLAAATAAVAASWGLAGAAPAAADSAPPPGTPPTVTADSLPTAQVDGVVWSQVVVGSTVYATGSFTHARPAGAAPGAPSEVVRDNLLAYDVTNGHLLPFDHRLNGQGLRITASPDGSRVYVGGDFTAVDGVPRERLAAFSTSDGSLVRGFAPTFSNRVRAIAATDDTVYVGGNFFAVNGTTVRTRLAAVGAATGAVLPWHPTADDNEVFALLVAPDHSRVIVGGRFTKVDGQTHVGIAAVDPTTGAALPWSSRPIPTPIPPNFSYVTDLATDGHVLYGSADGEGPHWFDGRFAADLHTGNLIWLDNCYGATYSLFLSGPVLYSVGHPHDCSSLYAFPDVVPLRSKRMLAETTYPTGHDPAPPGTNSNYSHQRTPSLLHWYPSTNTGTYTGILQGAWSIAGNAKYVVIGGEFTTVDGLPQQGLGRFAIARRAPDKVGPVPTAAITPTAASTVAGTADVTWTATWDMDNQYLRYRVLRDGQPIGQVVASSEFWHLPALSFHDTDLVPGTHHSYRIQVWDPFGNAIGSGTSNVVQVVGQPGPHGLPARSAGEPRPAGSTPVIAPAPLG